VLHALAISSSLTWCFKDIRRTIWNRSLAGRTSHGLSVQIQVSSQIAISTWKGTLKLAGCMVSARRRHCFVSFVSLERKMIVTEQVIKLILNVKSKAILVTGRGGPLVVRRRGSHIF
jgi:hypothetical protein